MYQKIVVNGVYFETAKGYDQDSGINVEALFLIEGKRGLPPLGFRPLIALSGEEEPESGSFALVGEIVELKRGEKKAELSNLSTCRYTYLVILPQGSEKDELPGAFLALIEAIKIQQKEPSLWRRPQGDVKTYPPIFAKIKETSDHHIKLERVIVKDEQSKRLFSSLKPIEIDL